MRAVSVKNAGFLTLGLCLAHPALAQDAAAPSPAPVVAAAAPKRVYTINPGDEVEIYVWGEERLQRVVRILPDGSFSFPLVGRIDAAGKATTEIEQLISKGLAGEYRGQVPQVTVSVKTPAGLTFSVMGRVKAPGTFTPGRYVNLLEALGSAGGADEFANLDNISIVRTTPTGLTVIRAKMAGLFKNGPSARDVAAGGIPQIESGDTVIVP